MPCPWCGDRHGADQLCPLRERREVPIKSLTALWPIPGQRNQERIKPGNTVIVDGEQWLVTSSGVETAVIEKQPPERRSTP